MNLQHTENQICLIGDTNTSAFKAELHFKVQLAQGESLCSQDFSKKHMDNVIASRTPSSNPNSISSFTFTSKYYDKLKQGLYPKDTDPESFKDTNIFGKKSFVTPSFYIFDTSLFIQYQQRSQSKSQ